MMDEAQQNALRQTYRMVRPKAQRLLRKAAPNALVDVDGLAFHLCPRDNFTEFMLWLNRTPHESKSVQHMVKYATGRRALFLDIGANCGVYTLFVARAMAEGGLTIAFEPNPMMIGRLASNVTANETLGRIMIEGCALSSKDGSARLGLHPLNYGQASLNASTAPRGIDVPTRRLGPYLQAHQGYDSLMLKIDVEGHEVEAIGDYLETTPLLKLPDQILIEVEHQKVWKKDLVGHLQTLGYKTEFEGEGNQLLVKP